MVIDLNNVSKAVITAGGLGTRLLPLTSNIPKEMFPLFSNCSSRICIKPTLQIIYEKLYETELRSFLFITGVGKRVIEDYFTPLHMYTRVFKDRINSEILEYMNSFYKKLLESNIMYVTQPDPRGFGDSILYSEKYVGNTSFLLHAGDDIILGIKHNYINILIETYKEIDADAVFFVEEVDDPRMYGVVTGREDGKLIKVDNIIEKPKKIISRYAIIAIYIFRPIIFEYLHKVEPDEKGEIQLSEALKLMIGDSRELYAVKLGEDAIRIDIGLPDKYIKSLELSYQYALRRIEDERRV